MANPTTTRPGDVDSVRDVLRRLECHELDREGHGSDGRPVAILDTVRCALSRLDAGTYGACVACGGWIEPARLEAIPYAERCLSCQRETEPASCR